mmetsp:Transcript_49459/g.143437  ORF Transcript_49459/g.143437 Transcript_49459/m.143437 type:complete len:248 (+) Transcript_49459:182-925(+)
MGSIAHVPLSSSRADQADGQHHPGGPAVRYGVVKPGRHDSSPLHGDARDQLQHEGGADAYGQQNQALAGGAVIHEAGPGDDHEHEVEDKDERAVHPDPHEQGEDLAVAAQQLRPAPHVAQVVLRHRRHGEERHGERQARDGLKPVGGGEASYYFLDLAVCAVPADAWDRRCRLRLLAHHPGRARHASVLHAVGALLQARALGPRRGRPVLEVVVVDAGARRGGRLELPRRACGVGGEGQGLGEPWQR